MLEAGSAGLQCRLAVQAGSAGRHGTSSWAPCTCTVTCKRHVPSSDACGSRNNKIVYSKSMPALVSPSAAPAAAAFGKRGLPLSGAPFPAAMYTSASPPTPYGTSARILFSLPRKLFQRFQRGRCCLKESKIGTSSWLCGHACMRTSVRALLRARSCVWASRSGLEGEAVVRARARVVRRTVGREGGGGVGELDTAAPSRRRADHIAWTCGHHQRAESRG